MDIGIGIIGGGYMGKAHSVAMAAVGAVFNTTLRPRLVMIAASTPESAERHRVALGFARATHDWETLVRDPAVEAVIIAVPPSMHRAIAELALSLGKPVFCEKPLGATLEDARAMCAAAEASDVVTMTGFNYVRTPATQHARRMIAEDALGPVHWFRGEHTEDFMSDPDAPAVWRTEGKPNGAIGDLAPHMINCALALMGPIRALSAEAETVFGTRPGPDGPVPVTNDDQAQCMCRFENGAMGHLSFSRVATGRKMGYAYEVAGPKGAIRFDQEDQNALWVYRAEGPEAGRGFTKILAGPEHPDYQPFCLGPGHGTGYQDQIIIEAKDFLMAIETGTPVWPTFADGLAAHEVCAAIWQSAETRTWVDLADI